METQKTASKSPLTILNRIYSNLPFNLFLGLKIDCLTPDQAGFRFLMRAELVGNTEHGILHGGVISTVLDTTGGLVATASALEKNENISPEKTAKMIAGIGTINMRVDYLRPGKGTCFFSVGTIMRSGNKVAVTRMELKNQDDTLIAVGTGTYLVG